jgi:biopolymer transport protein ExbD
MSKKNIPEINAGSMADIAFLLLIFFLVTTTMDIDIGIARKLPEKQSDDIEIKIKERNILLVSINRNNEVSIEDGMPVSIDDLKTIAIDFLDNAARTDKDGNKCDYCKGKKNINSSDHPKKAVISLQSNRSTSYGIYIAVQNELVAAYNFLRDREANTKYGKSYKELDEMYKKNPSDIIIKAKRNTIKDMYPMLFSEAKPKSYN